MKIIRQLLLSQNKKNIPVYTVGILHQMVWVKFYPQDSGHENWKDIWFFPQTAIQQNDFLSVVGSKAVYNKKSIMPRLKRYDCDELGEFCNSDS